MGVIVTVFIVTVVTRIRNHPRRATGARYQ